MQELKGRPEQELQVEPERPAAHVGDVHVERLAVGAVGPCGDLPQTGDALGMPKRSRWWGSKFSVSYGMHGRGPTSDMSPLSTLIS